MPNLEVQPGWPAARQLDRDEFASGGPNGNLNEHAKVFLARTEYLQQQKANKSEIVQGIHEFDTYALFDAAKSGLPLNCTVVIGEKNTTGSGQWDIGNNRWNGTTLAKSAFDPLTQAKAYSVAKTDYAANTDNVAFTKQVALVDLSNVGTFYGAYSWGDSTNNLDQVSLRAHSLAIRSSLIKVSKGAVVSGLIWRYIGVSNVVYFDQNKNFVSYLDAARVSGAAAESISVTVPNDGYVAIQQMSTSYALSLTITNSTVLVNKDNSDGSGGYISFDYAKDNYVSAKELDITNDIKYSCTLIGKRLDSSASVVTDAGFHLSQFIPCISDVLFIIENFYLGNNVTTTPIAFYDSNFNLLDKYSLGQDGSTNNKVLFYKKIKSPANTAYVRFCYAYIYPAGITGALGGNVLASDLSIRVLLGTNGKDWFDNQLQYYVKSNVITVRGDSLSQGIGNAALTAVKTGLVKTYGVGGENVMDTLYRAGANNIVIKLNGITVPSDGSTINVDAWFDFAETFVFNADGTYTVTACDKSNFYDNSATRGNIAFTHNGVNYVLNMNTSNATLKITSGAASSVTFNQDITIYTANADNRGVLFSMFGTNSGFSIDADPHGTTQNMDNLVKAHKRMADLYLGKCIVSGYHYAKPAVREYFRKAMESEFGERFVDFPTFLMGKGKSILKISSFTADEISFMSTNQGITSSSGNSALPIFSGDNTHPRTIVYQSFTNEMFERAYQLGLIKTLYKTDLVFISSLTVTPVATSIAVGGTTTASVGYTSPNNGSDIFIWESSNPAVATVTNKNWLNDWGSRTSTTITGVSTGTATITGKCRFGGATASFDITVV